MGTPDVQRQKNKTIFLFIPFLILSCVEMGGGKLLSNPVFSQTNKSYKKKNI